MRFVIAITGASGSIYAQRLIDCLAEAGYGADVVLSNHAHEVIVEELGELRVPGHFTKHRDRSMQVPFVSGSAPYDAMVVIPCSMGTLARIAHGYSDSVITRAADVFLKERRRLVLVPRETPWNLVHARNVVTLIEAGATMIPAMPSFYGRPQGIGDLVDTVIARVLDHLGVGHDLVRRWKCDPASPGDPTGR